MRFKRSFRITAAVFLSAVVLALGFSLWCNHKVDSLAERKVTSDIGAAPHCRVALVLGTNPKNKAGRPNTYFTQRVKTAAALYKAGKADYLLVSGDNHTHSYDEPSAMRDALVARGVPRSRIVLDYAGFRTLDSVVRARDVFGCQEILIVSQADHAARAVYLAEANGINATGVAARTIARGRTRLRLALREWLARDKMMLDLWFGKKPRFLGEKQTI